MSKQARLHAAGATESPHQPADAVDQAGLQWTHGLEFCAERCRGGGEGLAVFVGENVLFGGQAVTERVQR